MKKLNITENGEIESDEIIYLESDSNYTLIHLKLSPQAVLVAKSLCYVQDTLSPQDFVRVSRQHVINISYITKYWEEKEVLHIQIKDGSLFKASRRRSLFVRDSISRYISNAKKA